MMNLLFCANRKLDLAAGPAVSRSSSSSHAPLSNPSTNVDERQPKYSFFNWVAQYLAPSLWFQKILFGIRSPTILESINRFLATHPNHRFKPKNDAVHTIPFIARSEALDQLFISFRSQLQCLIEQSDRASLIATSGSPGSGKTRFLDKLLHLRALYKYAQEYIPDIAALFHPSNVFVLNITFNSKMPRQDFEVHVMKMLIARLLFQ
jgi:hypothetical protein